MTEQLFTSISLRRENWYTSTESSHKYIYDRGVVGFSNEASPVGETSTCTVTTHNGVGFSNEVIPLLSSGRDLHLSCDLITSVVGVGVMLRCYL